MLCNDLYKRADKLEKCNYNWKSKGTVLFDFLNKMKIKNGCPF